MTRRWKKRSLALILFLVMIACATGGWKSWWDSHCFDGYTPGPQPELAIRESIEETGDHRAVVFTFPGFQGETIPVRAWLPDASHQPWPCVIMLYGIGQDMEFVDRIAEPYVAKGYAIVMPEQYTRGERALDDRNVLEKAYDLRRRASLNVTETRHLIDAIIASGDYDPSRLYLWGLSFGAICSPAVMMREPRLAACVLTVGGADLPTLFHASPSVTNAGWWRVPAAWIVTSLSRPLEPLHSLAGVAPRPILMQNAEKDEIIPRICAETLHRAAPEPKSIVWYDSGHEGKENDTFMTMVRDGVDWLDALPVKGES